jgi:glutaredoxin 2
LRDSIKEVDMTKEVIGKMIVEETKNLSFEALSEVLDFIRFLKNKKYQNLLDENFREDIDADLSKLDTVSLLHLEDEFANYKEEYPHES